MAREKLNKLSIVQMLQSATVSVEVAPGQHLNFRPLNLEEMVLILATNQDVFLKLYSSAVNSKGDSLDIAPVLLAAPEVTARIIAMAADEEDLDLATASIRRDMAAPVQLIALSAIFKASVPDPKKALELLSEAMAQLRRLSEKSKPDASKMGASEISQINSPKPSTSSSATGTGSENSRVILSQ